MSEKAIGVFDSGMGGLTVAREVKRILPRENIIYFGDTMHVPYGDKSKETVVHYSTEITNFLLQENCKAIRKIRRLNPHLEVMELATPLFVPIIEEGFVNTDISKAAIQTYLSHKKLQNIDSLILGCTHYPLLSQEISKHLSAGVKIINSPLIVANTIARQLKDRNIANLSEKDPSYVFYVSDLTRSFQKQAKRFFGKEISLMEKKLNS
ncbi:unnamed protein product [Cyprideis torosa]|uniref:Uncharacterized protein n=1 Tax=Cyprideis torosa TaxID=163714 RepID=A0A7R8ZV43_9CRUS|nr:unnamed protein product [Cyprideis torosa]CAG0910411.1 unnamed protein product [Cyprideis torosa]